MINKLKEGKPETSLDPSGRPMIDSGDPIITAKTFASLKSEKSNNKCFDCKASSPNWASVNNAIFLCLKCAGVHRSMGVQVSFVRSLTLDSWSEKQLRMMSLGGNLKL